LHHPLSDRPPDASQWDRLLLLGWLGDDNSSSGGGSRDRNHSSHHSLRRSSFLCSRPHVIIGHPPLWASSLQGGDIDVEFPSKTASGGSSQDSGPRGLGKIRRWCPRLRTSRLPWERGGRRRSECRLLLSVLRDDENRLPHLHGLALLGQDPGDYATAWGGNLDVDLIRHY